MRIAVPVVLLSLAGCQGDPYIETYTVAKPERTDLIGRYQLTNQTVQPGGLAALHGKKSLIDLREDSTFTATLVPTGHSDPTEQGFFETLITCSGRWDVDGIGSIANGGRPPKTLWGVVLESEEITIQLSVTGRGAPYELLMTIGDPDAGRVLMFEREK
jgi:hypothetical protein